MPELSSRFRHCSRPPYRPLADALRSENAKTVHFRAFPTVFGERCEGLLTELTDRLRNGEKPLELAVFAFSDWGVSV